MFKLMPDDVPVPWVIVQSPIARRTMQSVEALLRRELGGPPRKWHEIENGWTTLLLAISDGNADGDESSPPMIEALVAAPGREPLAGPVSASDLRDLPVEHVNRSISARWSREQRTGSLREIAGERSDLPLSRPDRSDPDKFYAHVALRYLAHYAITANPTMALAAESGAPHATAQRWVVEARRRRYLPPARKGHAG